MTHTQQEQLTRLKAYLKERLEEWEKATAGPWNIEAALPNDVSNCTKAGCEVAIQGRSGPDIAWIKEYKRGDSLPNTLCIAHARTLAPITYANTLREIVWLEKRLKFAPYGVTNNHDKCLGYDLAQATLADECSDRLNEILDAFKEVLG